MEMRSEAFKELMDLIADNIEKAAEVEERKYKAGKDYRTAMRAIYGEVDMLTSFGAEMSDEELYNSANVIMTAAFDMLVAGAEMAGEPKPNTVFDREKLAREIREKFKPSKELGELPYELGFKTATSLIADFVEGK